MAKYEETFDNLVTFSTLFALTVNIPCTFFICSRKKLNHQPVVIFVGVLVVNDILLLTNENHLHDSHWPFLRIISYISCKAQYFIMEVMFNFESTLLVASSIVFTIRPHISMKNSAIIILAVFFATLVLVLPQTLEVEVERTYETKKCIIFFAYKRRFSHSYTSSSLHLFTFILPIIELIGFLFVEIFEKVLNCEIIRTSKEFVMLHMMLLMHIILTGPSLLYLQHFNDINIFFGDDDYPNMIEKVVIIFSIFSFLSLLIQTVYALHHE